MIVQFVYTGIYYYLDLPKGGQTQHALYIVYILKGKRNATYIVVIKFVLNTHSGIKVSGKLGQLTLSQITIKNHSSVTK